MARSLSSMLLIVCTEHREQKMRITCTISRSIRSQLFDGVRQNLHFNGLTRCSSRSCQRHSGPASSFLASCPGLGRLLSEWARSARHASSAICALERAPRARNSAMCVCKCCMVSGIEVRPFLHANRSRLQLIAQFRACICAQQTVNIAECSLHCI